MFRRVKTHDEEKQMYSVDAFAEEIDVKDVSIEIKSKENDTIPKYLKRVKKISDEKALMLRSLSQKKSDNQLIVKIPAFEPVTRDQFEIAKSIWPCHFFNTFFETFDEDEEAEKIKILLEIKHQKELQSLTTKVQTNSSTGITEGRECNSKNLRDELSKESKESCSDTSAATKDEEPFCSNICLIFDNNSMICTEYDSEKLLGHAILKAVRNVSSSQRGYLCTGYTAVLYREPCLSCAMALVHGRIKRILVFKEGLEAPYSKHKINHNKDLNHRCQVYFYES